MARSSSSWRRPMRSALRLFTSLRRLSCSNPVSRLRGMASTASAWRSERSRCTCRLALALAASAAAVIMAITCCRSARALIRPSTTSSRSSQRLSAWRVRRIRVSSRYSRNCSSNWRKVNCSGWPWTRASRIAPKLLCRAVRRCSSASTFSGSASRRSSTTTRMPSRSLSSRMSAMPPILPSFTCSASFSIQPALLS